MPYPLLISTAAQISTFVAALITAAVVVFTACYIQTKRFKVTNVYAEKDEKPSDEKENEEENGQGNVPENPEFVRVGLISDLHFPMIGVSLENVIYTLKKQDCDVIAIAGDLCQNGKGKPKMLAFMKRLSGEIPDVPIYVVPGNHDALHVCGKDPAKLTTYCEEIGKCGQNIRVLRNNVEKINITGASSKLVIAGFDEFIVTNKSSYITTYKEAEGMCGDGDKLLLLMHNPDIMERIGEAVGAGSKYSVALAGHTHGGQVYLPFNLEFKVLRNDGLPKKGFVYGLYDYCPNNKLYITCGLGQSFLPIRLGTTPEVAVVVF